MDRSSVWTALLATGTLVAVALTAQAKPHARYDWTAVNPVVLVAVIGGVALGRASRRFERGVSAGAGVEERLDHPAAVERGGVGGVVELSRVAAERPDA